MWSYDFDTPMQMKFPSDLSSVWEQIEQSHVENGALVVEGMGSYLLQNFPTHNATKIRVSWSPGSMVLSTFDNVKSYTTHIFVYDKDSVQIFNKGISDKGKYTDFIVPTNTSVKVKFKKLLAKDVYTFDDFVITCTAIDPVYRRAITPGQLGTVCLPMAVTDLTDCGVRMLKVAGYIRDAEGEYSSLVFVDVERMEAGVPYVFLAESEELRLNMTGDGVSEPRRENGLYGVFDRYPFASDADYEEGEYYIINTRNEIQAASVKSGVNANRAYLRLSQVPEFNPEACASGTRLLYLDESGVHEDYNLASGILQVQRPSSAKAFVLYDLYGRRLPKNLDFLLTPKR